MCFNAVKCANLFAAKVEKAEMWPIKATFGVKKFIHKQTNRKRRAAAHAYTKQHTHTQHAACAKAYAISVKTNWKTC